jgi:lipopolysaccharide export system protein LptA
LLVGGLLAFAFSAKAQQSKDTTGTVSINIEGAKKMVQEKTDSATIFKFYGDVRLSQGTTVMTCDTAFLNQEANNMEAFGNVNIVQAGGTSVTSNYLRYTGNTKLAYLNGDVSLTDGKNSLWSEELNYDLGKKIGDYSSGGTLKSESTTVSSNVGIYHVKEKDARFSQDVYVTDPQYNVTSTDLGYNTETKMVTFFGSSTIINDKSKLITSSGTWDGKNEVAHFRERSSAENKDQYIEADFLDYDKRTGKGTANGNVFALDTAMHTTLYCGLALYNEKTHQTWAYQKPVMKKANVNDSLYIRADTFFVAPVTQKTDSIIPEKKTISLKEKNKKVETADTTEADSSVKRFFIGYHHVLVFSDSLQARGDSISFSQQDSIMRLMKDPIAWSRKGQITGDTILLYIANNKLDKLFIPKNAISVSRSGPEKANMYDQIQGKTMTGFFDSNVLKEIIVFPNAEAIYYATDEDGAYIGVNQASSDKMKVFFDSNKIEKIVFEQEIKQTMTPMKQAKIDELRPRSVSELFMFENEEEKKSSTKETPISNSPIPKKENTKKRRKKETH